MLTENDGRGPTDSARCGDGRAVALVEPTCRHCRHTFARENALGGTFNGDAARYRCPHCTRWTRGTPP